MKRQFLEIGVLAAVTAVASAWVGWWTVPLVAAAWAFARHGEGRPISTSAVSASLAWVVLLGITAFQGPVGELSRQVGGVMGISGLGPLVLTLLYPAALAGAAAAVAHGLAEHGRR